MAVSSLLDTSLHAVMKDFHHHEKHLPYLPSNVKTKLIKLMAKRAVLDDNNILSVLHDGIVDLDFSECVLSQRSLFFVSSFCPRLRRLDLNAPEGCRNNINSTAFSHFFAHCKRLHVLSVRCCTLFDDSAVLSLTQTNTYLMSLCLSGCHMISDRSLHAIGQRCRYIQVLDLAKTKVSSDGLMAVSNGVCGKVLKELNISHCLNVTDEGIEQLVKNCPRLSILVFHSCPLLTSTSRDAIGSIGLKQLTWTVY